MEILVTVAIIAVLGSLLISGVGKAMERARTVGCLSNLRSLGAAIHSHAGEHDGFLVNNTYDSNGKETVRWQTELDPYLTPNWTKWTKATASKSAFRCPAKKPPGSVSDQGLFYGLNQELMNTAAEPNRGRLALASVVSPSQYVLASDTQGAGWIISSSLSNMTLCGVTTRHDGHPNFLYADGHVAPFTRELKGYLEAWNDPFYRAMWHARYRP